MALSSDVELTGKVPDLTTSTTLAFVVRFFVFWGVYGLSHTEHFHSTSAHVSLHISGLECWN